jgi:hypothetical protein
MKGVSFVTDESDRRIAVQIDLRTLEEHRDDVEDLLDGIIATAREHEETVPLDDVIAKLREHGKLP